MTALSLMRCRKANSRSRSAKRRSSVCETVAIRTAGRDPEDVVRWFPPERFGAVKVAAVVLRAMPLSITSEIRSLPGPKVMATEVKEKAAGLLV